MHISLDSALGRQRRLNQVGETISSIATPTAAYSLRSLTGGDPKVVRVRRESDNDEQDFTASEVASGAMLSYVNTQAIKPLDIKELVSTGRDGDFILANAAYSLRSLGTRQATIPNDAAPLNADTVVPASGKYVCQVRRSSDDNIKSFTADEITDGTLLSFVNEGVNKLDLQDETGSLVGNVTNKTATGFDFSVNNEGSDGFRNLLASSSTEDGTYVITFDAVLNSGSFTGVNTRTSTPVQETQIVSGSNSITYNTTAGGNIHFRTTGTAVANVSITNITLTQTASNGFVRTWYDQSVTGQDATTGTPNGNHATQTDNAKQPKIVNAGSFLTNGILFNTNINLPLSGTGLDLFKNVAHGNIFSIIKPEVTTTGTKRFFEASRGGGTTARFLFADADDSSTNASFRVGGRTTDAGSFGDVEGTTTHGNAVSLLTGFISYTGDTGTLFLNGTQINQDTSMAFAAGNTSDTSSDAIAIGGSNAANSSNFSCQEMIIYTTDQTNNRTAIEANIGSAHGINLPAGFDPTNDEVNGFVETWYDQFGTNNATQAVVSEQPKIVINGVLVSNGIDFDGSSQNFDIPTDLISNINSASAFVVAKSDRTTGSNQTALALSRNATGTNKRFYVPFITNSNFHIGYADSTQKILLGSANTNKHLFTAIANSSTNAEGFLDGTSGGTVPSVSGKTALASGGIGVIDTNTALWDGQIQEIIVYDSDQSSNRTALETNIQNAYPTLP